MEAFIAAFESDSARFMKFYNLIPSDLHDWDPVPKWLLLGCFYEDIKNKRYNHIKSENEEIDEDAFEETMIVFDNISYYDGIPAYLAFSMLGCWQFHREEYLLALIAKKTAYHTKGRRYFMLLQLVVILNKLGRYEEVIESLDASTLNDMYMSEKETEFKVVLTQFSKALYALYNPTSVEAIIEKLLPNLSIPVGNILTETLKSAEYTLKSQKPLERALEGCLG
jgi:hypothetical protein